MSWPPSMRPAVASAPIMFPISASDTSRGAMPSRSMRPPITSRRPTSTASSPPAAPKPQRSKRSTYSSWLTNFPRPMGM
jgi:hypothetical protein